jgi:hypothetical protein
VCAELFRDDDQGYAAWLAANARDYVLNIQRAMNRPTFARTMPTAGRSPARRRAAIHGPGRTLRHALAHCRNWTLGR